MVSVRRLAGMLVCAHTHNSTRQQYNKGVVIEVTRTLIRAATALLTQRQNAISDSEQ